MGHAGRGRSRLLMILGLFLAGAAWASARRPPPADGGQVAILVGLWGVLPVVLALRALLGAGWARRALAVVLGLRGALELEEARGAIAGLGEGGSVEAALTAAALALGCLLAAVALLVQRDLREMTRER